MKTLLMLGGSDTQVHAIERARELGIRVVTCDNRPQNPGYPLADEYYEVSTTNLDGVLDLARRLRVDGVLAYASDPAALTAAYVVERLGLPGDPLESVRRTKGTAASLFHGEGAVLSPCLQPLARCESSVGTNGPIS